MRRTMSSTMRRFVGDVVCEKPGLETSISFEVDQIPKMDDLTTIFMDFHFVVTFNFFDFFNFYVALM